VAQSGLGALPAYCVADSVAALHHIVVRDDELPRRRIAERRPVSLVLPARIRHYPIEAVEHARDVEVRMPLRGG
jgi:hypothetical protein